MAQICLWGLLINLVLLMRPFFLSAIEYQLQVFTGKEKDSNTDADVFVTIYGNQGNTGRRKLHQNDDGEKPFDKPQKVGR